METVDERIPRETFTAFVSKFPQASVELVVETDRGYLLARRTQEPAAGEWFWPGSRLYKGERFSAAVDRVAGEELGIEVDLCCQLGAYNHFWETDAFEEVEAKHTVNVVYHVRPVGEASVELDAQHDAVRYVSEPADDLHEYVNRYIEDLEGHH